MHHASRILTIGFVLLFALPLAHAATFVTGLLGANENPAVVTAGTGSATVDLDTVAHTMRVRVNFSGLNGNTTASHIHCCTAPPANVGVATTTPSFVGFPLGVTSGTMDQTYDTTLAGTWNGAFVTANGGTPAGAEAALAAGLAAGQAYLNIHSSTSPGGEIRGFLSLLAAPAALIPTLSEWIVGLLALLLAAATWVALRKRARSAVRL